MKPEPLKYKIKSIAGDRYFYIYDVENAVKWLKHRITKNLITNKKVGIHDLIDEAFEDVTK